MTISADAGMFDPRSYSNWLALVILIATAVLMLSLRRKVKTKDYLRSDPWKHRGRSTLGTAVDKNAFTYRAGGFAGLLTGPPVEREGRKRLYDRFFGRTRR